MSRRAWTARYVSIAAGLALAALVVALASGCGGARRQRAPRVGPPAAGAAFPRGPAFGLTEDNAELLWSPYVPRATPDGTSPLSARGGGPFQLAREQLSALHPSYVRLLIDWAALQPDPRQPPAFEARVSGCARAIGPCTAYGGVREELAAIASQQRASAGAEFQVVIDIFGTPEWAAQPASGCERGGVGAFSRALSAAGLTGYRALIHGLVGLGAREGVALHWWAPWNEPNDPTFLSPQRSSCSAGAPAVAPVSYAQLARAMAAQLRAEGGDRHMLLGELNAYQAATSDRTSIAQFVSALPAEALCLADEWSLHAYAGRGSYTPAHDPVVALEAALDARGGCAREARIWVTEAGAGAPHPGLPRRAGPAEEQAGCLALASQLRGWYRDPRVGAVLQYTFRDDPAFPVGLMDARLSRVDPAYRLWLAWVRARAAGEPPPTPARACAP
jgi:hypothetical protein